MQISIKYIIAFSTAFSAAQVVADDTNTTPRLQSNPIPAECVEAETELVDLEAGGTETRTVEVAISTSGVHTVKDADQHVDPQLENSPDPNAPIEVVEERYDSGNVKIRRDMTLDREGNYIKHGQWTMLSEAGEEIAIGKFVGNERQGIWKKTINWEDAPLLNSPPYPEFEAPFVSEAEFSHGKLNGIWSITDNQGRVASEWIYNDGKLDGKAKWFYPDGSIREEIDYVDGMLNGTWRIMGSDGTEIETSTYEQGRKLASKQEIYDNGVLRWDGMFLHETFVASSDDDWWDSKPVVYKPVGEAERHGEFTSWYASGQKKFSGTFRHEIRIGQFTWWHENTQIAVQGSFVDGERDGLWTWWHENGQKAIQGSYLLGKLDGAWSYWNAEGKLERKVDYSSQSAPIALHSVPTTDIRMKRPAPQPSIDQPVGTGVRVAKQVRPQFRRRNPIRK